MSVYLQRVRLYTTTKATPQAGTDSGVQLQYFVTTVRRIDAPPGSPQTKIRHGWKKWNLDNPWDDREPGRTDMYEVSLTDLSDVGAIVGEIAVPTGVPFSNFEQARWSPFYLKMNGPDWWKIDHYFLYGRFKEIIWERSQLIDHGWLLMAQRSVDVELSTDDEEASMWHQIFINGPLGPRFMLEGERPVKA